MTSDKEIWLRFINGEENAFCYIFDEYHLQLFEYGQRFTKNDELVRDSIQDLFFELARKKEKLALTDNISFYLLKSVRQKIFQNIRKSRNSQTNITTDQIDEFRLDYSIEVDPLEKELKLDRLAQAISTLPPRQKETIYLKYYKNLSNSEVADVMQVKYQSVSNTIQKAISKLRSILETDAESIIFFFHTYLK
ncbi:RNA polymerase sigma factor [Sunxiuqinia sp. A32]|uniref:RNA polymerase sigma factor n=1 Tax=Sunxiuqinia sp. A32 TaxID=3461496 RepID=UPI0040463CD2